MMVIVTLDGVQQRNVESFDTERGEVNVIRLVNGRPVRHPDGGRYETETLRGVVQAKGRY